MTRKRQIAALTRVSLAGAILLFAPVLNGRAQAPETPPPMPANSTRAKRSTRLFGNVVRALSREAGFTIVADSATAQTLIPDPEPVTDAAGLEARLGEIVKSLLRGARWVKLSLPDPPKETPYKGDDLADSVFVQARLFKTAVQAVKEAAKETPPGAVEVLGRRVAGDKAAAVTGALNLRPVYLVFRPTRPAESGEPSLVTTPEQQREAAKRVSDQLARMSPQDRAKALQQMFHQPNQIMQALLLILTCRESHKLGTGASHGRAKAYRAGRQFRRFPAGQ